MGGEVIGADALQIYRDLPVLTAIPDLAERCFAEPVTHEAFILDIVEHLTQELANRMEERGEDCGVLTLGFVVCADGSLGEEETEEVSG